VCGFFIRFDEKSKPAFRHLSLRAVWALVLYPAIGQADSKEGPRAGGDFAGVDSEGGDRIPIHRDPILNALAEVQAELRLTFAQHDHLVELGRQWGVTLEDASCGDSGRDEDVSGYDKMLHKPPLP
jgi:hypothetical protein